MKKGVTIKDIALRLNMSVSTVSKALNDDFSISTLTKERVKQLANEWNYIPNEAARHFKLNKTFTLGLIIPDMLDQFFALAVSGAEKVATRENYNVIISQSHEDPDAEEGIVDLMKRNRVDGLIVAITKKTQDMTPFLKLKNVGIPVVFLARPPKDDFFDYVTADNEGGAFKATEYLIKKGHKQVGHLMGPASMAVSQKRLQGYKNALEKYHIVPDPDLVQVVDLTEVSTFFAMGQYMKMKSPPTGIFSFKNYISLDAIKYIKKEFPERVNTIDFTGFGNLPLLRYLDHKPIASIEESSFEMGEAAAQLLFDIIKKEESITMRPALHIQIHCNLIVHE